MAGAPVPEYFQNAGFVHPVHDGVTVLFGAECNVLGHSGELDLPPETLAGMDIVVAGLHPYCGYEPASREEATQALVNAIETSPVDVISHPFRSAFPVNIEDLVEVAIGHGVLLEVNLGTLRNEGDQVEVVSSIRKMVSRCVERNHPLALSSDAHFAFHLGDYGLLEKLGLRPDDSCFWSIGVQSQTRLGVKLAANAKFRSIGA